MINMNLHVSLDCTVLSKTNDSENTHMIMHDRGELSHPSSIESIGLGRPGSPLSARAGQGKLQLLPAIHLLEVSHLGFLSDLLRADHQRHRQNS